MEAYHTNIESVGASFNVFFYMIQRIPHTDQTGCMHLGRYSYEPIIRVPYLRNIVDTPHGKIRAMSSAL